MLSGGFQFYVLPLLVIILAMAAGHYIAVFIEQSSDLWAFIGMLLALTWVFFRYRLKRMSSTSTLPKVTIL
jgi:positive regulator of sigma E activity